MVIRYLLKRLAIMAPVLLVFVTLLFFMVRLAPGGPFDEERQVSGEVLRNIEAKYHMDQPLWKQYGHYMGDLLRFDLGPSFRHANRTVNEIIRETFPISFELAMWSLGWALVIGIGSGAVAAMKHNTWLDYIPMSFSVAGICLPTFVTGPLAILIFGLWLDNPEMVGGWESWQSRILPSLTLGFAYAAYISRLTRGGLLEIRHQDFIRTARAKGIPEHKILWKHSLRGGLLPVVSFLGPAMAGLIAGALVTETIFNIPGLGRFFIQSALNRDYTVVLGTALFAFVLVYACNLLVDVLYVFLDPKVRYE